MLKINLAGLEISGGTPAELEEAARRFSRRLTFQEMADIAGVSERTARKFVEDPDFPPPPIRFCNFLSYLQKTIRSGRAR